jgi:hypothetical protein
MEMSRYWKEMYGTRSKDFIEGVLAGVEAFAIWKDGQQVVGCQQKPLKQVRKEIIQQLGGREEDE